MKNIASSLAVFVLVCLMLACESADQGEELALTFFRRSVLDQQPRMLTLRFGDHQHLAYDLKQMRPVKLWNGGVLWNGAVFNRTKTVQPTSYGDDYDSFDSDVFWELKEGTESLEAELQFNSYELKEEGILFKYSLTSDSHTISIQEKPSLVEQGDSMSLLRTYDITGLPKELTLSAGGQTVVDESSVKTSYFMTSIPERPDEITSDNGAQYWLDKSGCTTCHYRQDKMIGPSYVDIANTYAGVDEALSLLVSRVKNGSVGEWGDVPMIAHPDIDEPDLENMIKYILSLQTVLSKKKPKRKIKNYKATENSKAGFGAPVVGVHPAYDLITIRPNDFKPGVGGMAFMPDGSLILSTWDSIGGIYRLSNLATDDPNAVKIELIASGLAEPLGLTTVGEDIYVLQKHELTKLIDHDQDDVIDEYVCVNNQFGVTADFHEFSYGLVHVNGRFYGGLGLAMRLMSSELQLEDRGTIFSVSNHKDFEIIARGLRQTNGIGVGPDGSIIVTDNQGQWSPACKLIQIEPGAFYGCQHGTGDRYKGQSETPPAVWMPQDEIGNSPGEPILMQDGPYVGQMIHGDVTHGGIKRVYLEKRGGHYQGCVFRFSQGLEAGINRLTYGPDGALYAGGVGMNGGWSHKERRFGLQKLKYNAKVPFEMLSINSRQDGFEIQLTKAITDAILTDFSLIKIQQWYYQATASYGGPKLGLEELAVNNIIMSADRTKLTLQIDGLREGHVVYFMLSDQIKSTSGESLWSGEAWYTLNKF